MQTMAFWAQRQTAPPIAGVHVHKALTPLTQAVSQGRSVAAAQVWPLTTVAAQAAIGVATQVSQATALLGEQKQEIVPTRPPTRHAI